MKARFFAIAALVLGLASCQKDFAPEANLGGEVDYRLEVSATELGVTRAGDTAEKPQNANDSAFGAIDYFQSAEGVNWSEVDLRYTLEIYDANEDGSLKLVDGKPVLVKDRDVQVVPEYKAVTFVTRLAPKRNYRFVVFADFVEEGAATPAWSEADKLTKDGLHHSFAKSLTNITLINEDINDEASDAYFAFKHVVPSNNTQNTDAITLTRPYGKVRVVATDLAELNLNVKPGSVSVAYNKSNPALFNAVTGLVDFNEVYTEKEFDYDYVKEGAVYTEGKDALYIEKNEEKRYTHKTIFTDYILASDTQHTINFNMLVKDTEGADIKATAFSTEIPVQRNHLTTIIGNVLTTASEVKVTIDDNFANEAFVIDGEFTLTEDWNVNRSIIVEEGSKAVINLNGYNIINNSTSTELGIGDGIIVYGELEINGEGTIQGNTRAIWARGETGAKVTINGGNIVGAVAGDCEVVYASGNGQIEINGGTFEAVKRDEVSFAAPQYAVLNLYGNGKTGCDIKVKGGSFKNFDPSNNISENPKHNFCAEGYSVYENDGWYNVVFTGRTVEIDVVATNADELAAAFANPEVSVVALDGEFETIIATADNKTIVGLPNSTVGCIHLNAKNGLDLLNLTFDAAKAQWCYMYRNNTQQQMANVITGSKDLNPIKGAFNLTVEYCTFTGTFGENHGAALAFADRGRASGFSGNITIENCTFDTKNGYYDIYGYYCGNGSNGYGNFDIKNNVFKSKVSHLNVYLGRYASSTPVVVKGNTFETYTSLDKAVYVQDHGSYGVSIDASDNTFKN